MIGYPIESKINECTLDNTYPKVVPLESDITNEVVEENATNSNTNDNKNVKGGDDFGILGYEDDDYTFVNNKDSFKSNIENVDIDEVIDEVIDEELNGNTNKNINMSVNGNISGNINTNVISNNNTNNSVNNVSNNLNNIIENAAEVSNMENNVEIINAPTDNSDNINTQQIVVDENIVVEIDANVVPPNGNNVNSTLAINNANDKPIEVISNAANAENVIVDENVIVNENVKILGNNNGAILEVKDINGNIQNVELENGDEIDLINEDNEIEEQFVIGGDNVLLNSLFGGIGDGLQQIFGGGTKQRWGVAAAATLPFILLILFIVFKMKWLQGGSLIKIINNHILSIILVAISAITYLTTYGAISNQNNADMKNLFLNLLKNGSILIFLGLSAFKGQEDNNRYKALFFTYGLYLLYRLTVNSIDVAANDESNTKIYLSTIDNDLILYILSIFIIFSKGNDDSLAQKIF